MRAAPLCLLLTLPSAALAARPPGETIDPAVVVDVTPDGLNSLDLLAGAFLPQSIPLPELSDGDTSGEDCIDLWFDEICWVPWTYAYEISGLDVALAVDFIDFTPATDRLDIDAQLTASIASSGDPGLIFLLAQAADIDLFGLEFGIVDIVESCDVWLEPTPIGFTTAVTLALEPGASPGDPPEITVDVAPVDISLTLDGLTIDGCVAEDILGFVNAVNDFLGVFNFDLYQLIVDLVEPILNDQIDQILGDLEGQLQALFTDLSIEETVDLLGSELTISLAPSDLVVTEDGLRFALAGAFVPPDEPAACVASYAIPGSPDGGGTVPAIGSGPADVSHGLAAMVDDDFVNQALFSAWYGGLLCFELGGDDPAAGGLDLPIPLDTSLLGLLSGGAFDELFPESAPIAIVTRPRRPPEAFVDGDAAIDIVLDGLGLDLYAELDGRLTRAVGIDVGAEIGVDLPFDPATGELAVDLGLGGDAFEFAVVYNDLLPSASQPIADGLAGLVDTLVGSLLGPLLGDLSFVLPTFSGIGVSELVVDGHGPDGDFLGLFASVDLVDYDGGDLADGGCGEGCGGGCSTGGAAGWLAVVLPLWYLRRRP